MKRLPVDVSTFSELRAHNYVYVDKTNYLYSLITGGRRYFLSRPRRFGKSLLVSTLQEILSGNKELFDGLWIGSSDYVWQQYGIITLDFSKLHCSSLEELQKDLQFYLHKIARQYTIESFDTKASPLLMLDMIIEHLFHTYGRVAILIDEYDAPLLKTLKDQQLAENVRNYIYQLFTIIKSLDAHVQFVFITGVSSFAKAGLFSGINNLQIITLRESYSAICGYTQEEVEIYFKEYIASWADSVGKSYEDLFQHIKDWYNGYSFGYKVPKVYNPFSVMNALDVQKFENFWFQSGTPTFLVDILKKEYKTFDPADLRATMDFLSMFDIDTISVLSLMFQSGYLTIVGYDNDSTEYILDYPNIEVKIALQKYLLAVFVHTDTMTTQHVLPKLFTAFNNQTIELAIDCLYQLFANIPYQLHIKQERFYHSLLIMMCIGADIKYHAEYSTSLGRIDLVLYLPRVTYIIEIKFNTSAQHALEQIEDRRYYQQFIDEEKPTVLLGLAFYRAPSLFTIEYKEKHL